MVSATVRCESCGDPDATRLVNLVPMCTFCAEVRFGGYYVMREKGKKLRVPSHVDVGAFDEARQVEREDWPESCQ